jgi:hypothetical protein
MHTRGGAGIADEDRRIHSPSQTSPESLIPPAFRRIDWGTGVDRFDDAGLRRGTRLSEGSRLKCGICLQRALVDYTLHVPIRLFARRCRLPVATLSVVAAQRRVLPANHRKIGAGDVGPPLHQRCVVLVPAPSRCTRDFMITRGGVTGLRGAFSSAFVCRSRHVGFYYDLGRGVVHQSAVGFQPG